MYQYTEIWSSVDSNADKFQNVVYVKHTWDTKPLNTTVR